ncbi:MAG: hypothetical protein JO267_00525 [Alphaproteobacteria bacterium]|nr:hypothetical protein [Alphaproteobacteria bacterium]
MIRMVTGLYVAATCFAAVIAAPAAHAQTSSEPPQLVTNGPQVDPGDPGDQGGQWSRHANVRESRDYDALIHSNPAFRAQRMQEECGPITDPQLHASCVASFGAEGSSTPPSDRDHWKGHE